MSKPAKGRNKRRYAPRRPWSAADRQAVRSRYPDEITRDIARDLGRSERSVYSLAGLLGLRKSAAFRASQLSGRLSASGGRGRATRFAPGNTPWNKGLKGWNAPGSDATQFKPGGLPPNTLPVGSLRLGADGHLERKFREAPGGPSQRWRSVHRLVWEAVHGPVPPGHRVCFKPGMFTNRLHEITLDRLELLSFAQILQRNSIHNDPEMAQLHQLKGAITRQVNRITKESQGARP